MKQSTREVKPPSISRWLLNKLFCRSSDAAAGDFEEVFHQIRDNRGITAARMWYRSQVLLSLLPFFSHALRWRLALAKNYLYAILRSIKKHKSYTVINILGLAMALCCTIFLWLYISHEKNYDTFHPEVDQVFRISMVKSAKKVETRFAPISWAAGTSLKQDFPQVAHLARLGELTDPLVRYQGRKFYQKRVYYAEPAIFRIFSNSFLRGNPDTALKETNSVVINRRTAKKYFGWIDPMGKVIRVDNQVCQVTGVVADCPSNTHWKYDMVISAATYYKNDWEKDWFSTQYHTYVRLHRDTDTATFASQIRPLRDLYVGQPPPQTGKSYHYELVPIPMIHLTSSYRFEIEPSGNSTYILLFSLVAIFILLIAAVNYINLSTARSLNRSGEVGIRKVVGAQQNQLMWQFLSESLVLAFFALGLSLVLALLLLPAFNQLSNITITTTAFMQADNLLFFLIITIVFALAAGIIPAFSLSAISPSTIFQKLTLKKSGQGWLRRVLVLGQFSVSIALMVMTITIFKQVHFMKNRELGFDNKQKICLQVRGGSFSKGLALHTNFKGVKDEFLKISGVTTATASSSVPGAPLSNFGITSLDSPAARSQSMYHLYVDHEYIPAFQLRQMAGKGFSVNQNSSFQQKESRSGFIINQAAVEALGFETAERAINTRLQSGLRGRTGTIIGVVDNFHFRGLQQPVEPLVFEYLPHLFDTLTLKVNTTDIQGLMDRIQAKWRQLFPNLPMEYFFLNENFNQLYHSEVQMGGLVAIFTLLGLGIAGMGLWGMALFNAENRNKEVGIRKVLGASFYKIITLLSKDFVQIILLANIISWPLAYWLANQWLADFAKKIELGLDTFLLAGGLALLIGLATIGYQSIRAALVNPIEGIKYE